MEAIRSMSLQGVRKEFLMMLSEKTKPQKTAGELDWENEQLKHNTTGIQERCSLPTDTTYTKDSIPGLSMAPTGGHRVRV